MDEKPLSYLINSFLPDYIKTEYPIYVSFITKYLEIIESETGPFKVLNEITKFIDVDITPEETLPDFVYQYLHSFPEELLEDVNVREFITNSKNFYSVKGNEAATRFIFNLLNGSISFYYPSTEIFELNVSNLSGNASGLYKKPTHKLHDNSFYAYYVYEIASDLNYSEYEDIIRDMTHPIGEKLFFKKLICIDTTGTIFDAQISETMVDVWMFFEDIMFNDDLLMIDETELIQGVLTTAYAVNYSPIIEDHFPGVSPIGPTIGDYFGFSVFTLTRVSEPPVEINYAIQNFNISFSGSTISGTGFDIFTKDTNITITGSTLNDGSYTISSTDPTTTNIIITGSFTAEGTGATITISEDDK